MRRVVEPISRVAAYGKRHGIRATVERAGLFLRRLFASNRMVLFYLDFPSEEPSDDTTLSAELADNLSVEVMHSREEMASEDWERVLNFWNPDLCRRSYTERFRQGASLWLIRCDGNLAGYGWTITGCTVEPHYYPLGANDVHLFDFLVFPEYRGRNLNPNLLNFILSQLAAERLTRAYIEVREWNHPQLKSLAKTSFKLLGVARKATLFGLTFVQWTSTPVPVFSENAQVPAKKHNQVRIFSR